MNTIELPEKSGSVIRQLPPNVKVYEFTDPRNNSQVFVSCTKQELERIKFDLFTANIENDGDS